jgi:hypothetical protein
MTGPAISHTYRYAFESQTLSTPSGPQLFLSTSDSAGESVPYFRGKLTQPRRTAGLLRGVAQVVQSRFFVPMTLTKKMAILDPVVTCGDDNVRFEVFSSCCSVYARLDLLPAALDGERVGRGTTNVDFSSSMRAALTRVRDDDAVGLTIGALSVEIARGTDRVVERKVALPLRWLKGFTEVQVYQSRMVRQFEVAGPEAVRFLRSVPRDGKISAWVVPSGRGLRLSQTPSRGAVRLAGVVRLRVVEELARHARSLRVYLDAVTGASAWELVLDEARFHLVLSPDVSRGISGEGQVLSTLAGDQWTNILPRVRATLRWQSRVDALALGSRFELSHEEVSAALAALASRGLVGYDLAESAYFHRELPFDLGLVESLHPRLKDARALVAAHGVRVTRHSDEQAEAYVSGTAIDHRVLMSGGAATCTCPWYAKHRDERGPCKHVLAVQIVLADDGSVKEQPT